MNHKARISLANMPQLKHILLPALVFVATTIHSSLSARQVSPNNAGSYRPQVGQPHPDFTLPEINDGKQVSLEQFRGKKLLLLHFASW